MLTLFRDDDLESELDRPLILNLTLKVNHQVIGYGCMNCSLLREAGYRLSHFGTRAEVILGRYPVHWPLTLNLTLTVKWKVKGHGRVTCRGSLAIV